MIFRNLFQKPKVKSLLSLPQDELTEMIDLNRKTLSLVDNWIDEVTIKNSFFSYGVPDFIKVHLNKELDNNPTYSDYILFIARKYFSHPNYFEIGVSVGKNFFQILNGIENATITGFDIEEVNPVLENKLNFVNKTEWETPVTSIKKNNSSLRKYTYKGKEVCYMSADVWDEKSWARLYGKKFNVVFSDALHTPEAILFEFEMLVKYELLDEKFAIIWDDLIGEMQTSFYKIIKKYNKLYSIRDIYLVQVNGWIGQYEKPHTIGIISNFNFK